MSSLFAQNGKIVVHFPGSFMCAKQAVKDLQESVDAYVTGIAFLTSSARSDSLVSIGFDAFNAEVLIDKMPSNCYQEAIELKNEVNQHIARAESALSKSIDIDKLEQLLPPRTVVKSKKGKI